jgi:hypothetical protein
MSKENVHSRVQARAGNKADIRKKCQNATAGVVRRSRRAVPNYVGPRLVAENGGSKNGAGIAVAAEPAISVYVLANRSRQVAIFAVSEEEAREKAVRSGLVRKPENARLVAVNP